MNIKTLIIYTASIFCAFANAADSDSPKQAKKAGSEIVLKGSDLIKPIIESVVLPIAKRDNLNFSIDMKGTYPVLRQDNPENFDIAVVAIPKGQKLPPEYVAFPFAYQAAMVVVNISNPIDEISTDSLRKIYSNVGVNRIETWDQIGIRYAGLRNILPMLTGYSDGVYLEMFKYACFNGESLGDWVSIMKNTAEVLSNIRVNNAAIGVVGRVYDKNMVKILPVSDSKTGGNYRYAFPPTQTALFNGDYPLSLNFYLLVKKENAKKVKKLINILLSKSVADKLDTSGFFSAPQESRKKSLFELDIL